MSNLLAYYADGTVHQEWDDVNRIYYEYSEQGIQTLARGYNDVENAEADERTAQETQDTNKQTIEQKLDTALDNMQLILDTSNVDLNSQPAPALKDVARAVRLLIRVERKKFDAVN